MTEWFILLRAVSVDVLVLRDSYRHEVAGNGFIFNYHFRSSMYVSVFYQSIDVGQHMAHGWPSSGHCVKIQGVRLKTERRGTASLTALYEG
jgi:hypothetical protein